MGVNLTNLRRGSKGLQPLGGVRGVPEKPFFPFCSPPQAARERKKEAWGHPKPRQEDCRPPAPPLHYSVPQYANAFNFQFDHVTMLQPGLNLYADFSDTAGTYSA